MKPGHLRVAILLVTMWLAGVPIFFLAYGATHAFADGGGVTLRYLHKVFATGTYWVPLRNTLLLAAAVAIGATLLGSGLGLLAARVRLYGARYWEVALMAPIFISPFIGIIGWITLAGPKAGLVNGVLRAVGLPEVDVFSFAGAVLTMSLFFAPFSYALVRHAAGRLDAALEEAAAVCGATRLATLWHVVLPLLWPSLLSGTVFAFVLAAEMFSIPGLLLVPHGYPVLAYSVYQRTTQYPLDYSEAAAIGFMLLGITALGMLAYARLVRVQERFVTVAGRGARTASARTGHRTRTAATAACGAYVLVAVILPIAAIALRALIPFFTGDIDSAQFSTANIRAALRDPAVRDALWNSLAVTVTATVFLLALSLSIAVARIRYASIVSRLTAAIASLPIGVPGVLIGVGLLWAYIRTPIYATLAILVLVMLARFLPVAVRMFETALLQIDPSLEEAASVAGATPWRVTWHVRLPLLVQTMRSAVIVSVSQIWNELTASALVFTATSSVLPVVVFNYSFDGDYARASACALVQVVVLLAIFAAVGLASRGPRRPAVP